MPLLKEKVKLSPLMLDSYFILVTTFQYQKKAEPTNGRLAGQQALA
jgi:hypothetical protein